MFQILKNWFHSIEGIAAEIFYGFPSRRLKIIGITGTDGKTTTAHLIYHILTCDGKKVSMISSIYADIGGEKHETGFHVTTPRPWIVRKYFKQATDAGSEYFVLEVTSHALEQNRVWGVGFEASVITNVTPEHRYYHKNFEQYAASKVKLLLQSRRAYVNKDAKYFSLLKKLLDKKRKRFSTYSLADMSADMVWSREIKTRIKGDFNRENILAAYAICRSLRVKDKQIRDAVKTFRLPVGRLDVVYKKDFTVIIDFAHTPNSIKKLLLAINDEIKVAQKHRIIHIFGAASERDDEKRPEMGAASAIGADIVILTEEDYRNEDVQQIFNQVSPGLTREGFEFVEPRLFESEAKEKTYTTIPDRAEAIEMGVRIAQKGDVVVITGKSHEKSLARAGVEHPWDEYKAVEKALSLNK